MKSNRYSGVKLLVALGLLFVTAPFLADLPRGDLIESALLTLVMLFAVLAVAGRRRTLVVALVLVSPAAVGRWINHISPDFIPMPILFIARIVFFGFVVAQLVGFVLRAPCVDKNVLCAGIAGYLILGLLWAPAYVLVAHLNPGAFALSAAGATMDAFNSFYFSFITLCTVGYGDVTPVSKVAKMLAVIEAIAGLFYVAIFISRLVAIYSTTQPASQPDAADK